MLEQDEIDLNDAFRQMHEMEMERYNKDQLILEQVKKLVSSNALSEIECIIEESENTYDYSIEKEYKGELEKQDQDDEIKYYYVDQTTNGGYSGDDFAGTISIPLPNGLFFQFHYSM